MRRVVITGANKGIGLAIVKAVLGHAKDTFVLLGSRDRARGEAAVRSVVGDAPKFADRVELLEIDVSDDASVEHASERVRERFAGDPAPLYGVVNNAGVGGQAAKSLRDTLEVNTLGIRRVSEAFIPLLDPSEGRIVNVTSASGPSFVAKCSPERRAFFCDPNAEWSAIEKLIEQCLAIADDADAFSAQGLSDGNRYGLSKALANSVTMLLARKHPGLQINACTPGFIETDMTRPYAQAQDKSPAAMGMKPPVEGTRAPMHLLFGALEGNGRYYGSDAKRSPLDRYRSPGDPEYSRD